MPFRWFSNKYMCFFCCTEFVDSSKLKEHTNLEHEDPKLNNVLKNLEKDIRVKLDISDISCKKCLKPIEDLNGFAKHISEAHDVFIDEKLIEFLYVFKLSDNGMNCLECGQSFRFFGPLLIHVYKLHNKLSPYLCEICGQGFVAKKNMQHHMKRVHTDPWTCGRCKKNFSSHHALQSHNDKSHRAGKLECPKCPEVLGSAYLKKRHLALVHDVKSVQFCCDECPKVFTRKNSLVTHRQRVHLKEKTVSCDICGFRVFNKDYLMRHLVKHTDERPYECQYCKKAFQRKKTLQLHVRIHTDDRRFVCKDCGKAFVQVASLKLHMRTHHALPPASDVHSGT